MKKPKHKLQDWKHRADGTVSAVGKYVYLDTESNNPRFSPTRARALAMWLLKASDYLEKRKK